MVFGVAICLLLAPAQHPMPDFIGIVLFILLVFLCGGNIILLINYILTSRGQKLIISRSNDTFWFGRENDIVSYSKNDIQGFTLVCYDKGRSPVSAFAAYTISLSDKTSIHFNSLLIGESDLMEKMPLVTCRRITGWPWQRMR